MCYNLEELAGTVGEEWDDGRIAFYDGEFQWLIPCEDHPGEYYFADMTEDEALRFLL